MEVFSSVPQEPGDLEERVADRVVAKLEELVRRQMGESETAPAPKAPAAPTRANKGSGGKPAPTTTPRGGENPPTAGRKRRGVSEARKARKKEKKRIKRQEEARARAGALQGPITGQRGGAREPCPVEETGPRAKTRAGAQTVPPTPTTKKGGVQPPPQRGESKTTGVPVPAGDWQVVRRREEGANRGPRPAGLRSYAEAATRAPAPSTGARGREPTTAAGGRGKQQAAPRQQQQRKQVPTRRPPKTAAVQVTCPPDQYASTLRLARERVSLQELGIPELRPRRAKTGGPATGDRWRGQGDQGRSSGRGTARGP